MIFSVRWKWELAVRAVLVIGSLALLLWAKLDAQPTGALLQQQVSQHEQAIERMRVADTVSELDRRQLSERLTKLEAMEHRLAKIESTQDKMLWGVIGMALHAMGNLVLLVYQIFSRRAPRS